VQEAIVEDLLKHWVLLSFKIRLNGRTAFNSELILMLWVLFRSRLDI